MHIFTFTDNRPIHKHVVTLNVTQLAAHLAKDVQFMYYWRNGFDPILAANRSLYLTPPDEKATVCAAITEEQWTALDAYLTANFTVL